MLSSRNHSGWYITVFKFLNGVATPARLDPSQLGLTIPQPDGLDVTIPLQSHSYSSKSLGVRSGPSNDCVGQVDAMKEKGLEYAAKVGSSQLKHHEVWRSLTLQAYPSISLVQVVFLLILPTSMMLFTRYTINFCLPLV